VRRTLGRVAPPLVVLVVLLAAWEGWVRWRDTPAYLLPAPSRIASAGVDAAPLLGDPILVTLGQTLTGLAVGALVGGGIAVLVAVVPLARRALGPLLIASQTFPTILLAPLLVVVFGLGSTPKVVLVALVTFFPVAVTTTAGIDGADVELVDLVRGLGGGRTEVLRLVQLPAAVPAFFAGLQISAAYAVAAAVFGQMNGGDQGLGVFINRSRSSYLVDRMFAAFVVIAALSGALYVLVGVLGRLAAPWTRADGGPVLDASSPHPVHLETAP
jgi:ABC-type nitrate/sulfonate/bicarbonate transport system permease component